MSAESMLGILCIAISFVGGYLAGHSKARLDALREELKSRFPERKGSPDA